MIQTWFHYILNQNITCKLLWTIQHKTGISNHGHLMQLLFIWDWMIMIHYLGLHKNPLKVLISMWLQDCQQKEIHILDIWIFCIWFIKIIQMLKLFAWLVINLLDYCLSMSMWKALFCKLKIWEWLGFIWLLYHLSVFGIASIQTWLNKLHGDKTRQFKLDQSWGGITHWNKTILLLNENKKIEKNLKFVLNEIY